MPVVKTTGGRKIIVDSGSSAPLSKEDSEKIKSAYEQAKEREQKGQKHSKECFSASCKQLNEVQCNYCWNRFCQRHISLSHPNHGLNSSYGHICEVYYQRFLEKKNISLLEKLKKFLKIKG